MVVTPPHINSVPAYLLALLQVEVHEQFVGEVYLEEIVQVGLQFPAVHQVRITGHRQIYQLSAVSPSYFHLPS